MAQITIGCRLPHGIVIENPLNPAQSVELAGANRANALQDSEIIILRPRHYGVTQVDADLWAAWKSVHKDFPAYANGSIFEAKNENEARTIAAEREAEKTGFEAMAQIAQGVTPAE